MSVDPKVAAVILAAGSSSRLGTPKQRLPYRGRTLLVHAAEVALSSRCRPVAVVLGDEATALREDLWGLDLVLIENPRWREGMGTSVAAGIAAVAQTDADAAVLMLCDQPRVDAALIDRLIAAHRDGGDPVACGYAGTIGVPALFGRGWFPDLIRAEGDAGARGVIARADRVEVVPFPDGAIDVDTWEDYRRLDDAPA